MDPNFEFPFDDSEPLQLLSRVRWALTKEDSALIRDLTIRIRDLKQEAEVLKVENRNLKRRLDSTEGNHVSADEPAAKKRKLAVGSSAATESQGGTDIKYTTAAWQQYTVVFEAADISFALPMRKKCKIQIVEGRSPAEGGIRVETPGDEEDDVVIAWSDIEQIIRIPVPEKAQPSSQFVVIPKPTLARPPLMWTTPHTPPKPNTTTLIKPYPSAAAASLTLDTLVHQILDHHLATTHHPSKQTITPTAHEFSSTLVQAHRKSEKAYHVKAFRGSKEGFLYFLPTGILFAPRAPLLYFPFHAISSISYSSVLQRTFNLNIAALRGGGPVGTAEQQQQQQQEDGEEEDAEFEFAMLDQADFAGIDAYVKRHGLNDASLAAHRRAKVYNVNNVAAKAGSSAGGDAGGSGVNGSANGVVLNADDAEESELAKAERELQDAEDEEEEDYDPSGGESEGSGSESEEEEGEGGYEAADGDEEM